ncbi:MAG TPA: hypothetical protein VFG47_22245, partial [Geminicoccaceae bacterium]|nr:hypothetical protein [Geminicoccaceae bacterium]
MTLTQEFAELRSRTETELNDVLRNAATIDEVDAAERALLALHDARLRNLLADFNGATRAFVELTEGLQDVIDAVQAGSPRSGSLAALSGLLTAAGAVYAGLRAPERLASATTAGDVTVTLPVRDEHEAPPGPAAARAPAPAATRAAAVAAA